MKVTIDGKEFFNVDTDDKLFQFYAGTGKIVGMDDKRGIHALIKMLCE